MLFAKDVQDARASANLLPDVFSIFQACCNILGGGARDGWLGIFFSECRQRSSELHRAKKSIKSEVEERYLLNAEEIAQVRHKQQGITG